MSKAQDSIKLIRPLSWVSPVGLTGFVNEIGRAQLLVSVCDEGSEDIDDARAALTIRVTLSPQRSFSIKGLLVRVDEQSSLLSIDDPVSLAQLQDLQGQIRKDQHIEICRGQDVEASDRFTGFERVQFVPEALPELCFDELDTSVHFLSRSFSYPLLITGMTGGIEKGAQINRRLALAAQKFNIPMGVGSQRIALDNDDFSSVFAVKKHAPDVFLIGNLGFAQLRQDNYLALCHRAIDMIDADALAIHVNVLQESIQMEGDRNFSGIVERLYTVCDKIDKPIIIKEVGAGISPDTVKRLLDAGVAAVDIGGRGGTSWGYIEGLRSSSAQTKALAESFRDWGIPTAYSLASAREVAPSLPLIATGGIRDGHTVAKAVALGADMVGVGLPLLKAALDGEEQPQEVLSTLARGLKIAMIATGSTRLNQLAQHIALGVPMERRFEALLLR